jgi:hypothetical protein
VSADILQKVDDRFDILFGDMRTGRKYYKVLKYRFRDWQFRADAGIFNYLVS